MTWDEASLTIGVDADGKAALTSTPVEALATSFHAGELDLELVVRIERDGPRTAWYARPDTDSIFGLVLVDEDGDDKADVRHEARGTRWVKEPSYAQWLTTEHLQRSGDGAAAKWRVARPVILAVRRFVVQ